MSSCTESFGNAVESAIQSAFSAVGSFVGKRPRQTILYAIILTVICGAGFMRWETENRGEKLWVPQDTTAEAEAAQYETLFPRTSRFNTMILQTSPPGGNVLTKEILLDVA